MIQLVNIKQLAIAKILLAELTESRTKKREGRQKALNRGTWAIGTGVCRRVAVWLASTWCSSARVEYLGSYTIESDARLAVLA